MSQGKKTNRPVVHVASHLQPFWDLLAGKDCPVCRDALDNGTALVMEPGGLFRHLHCERAPRQWERTEP